MNALKKAAVAMCCALVLVAAPAWADYPSWSRTTHTFESSGTHNVPMPNPSAGDLLIFFHCTENGTSTQNVPAGWTRLAYDDDDGGNSAAVGRMGVYAKVATGEEGTGNVNFSLNNARVGVGHLFHITGWHGALADGVNIDASVVPFLGENSNSFGTNEVTASWGAAQNLFISGVCLFDDPTALTAAPSNYTSLESTTVGTTGTGAGIGTAVRELTAASDDPGNFTAAAGADQIWFGSTLVIRPASAPSTAPAITSVTPSNFHAGQSGIVIAGGNFGASQGAVFICPTDDIEDADCEAQTVTAWADDEITFTSVLGANPLGATAYLFVTSDTAESNDAGAAVSFVPVATKLVFGSQPGNIIVGQTFGAFTVRAVDDANGLDTLYTGNVSIALDTGSGTLGGTTTKAAVAGIATFNDITLDTLNVAAVIEATADGLTAASSDAFDVTAGGTGTAGFPATSRLGGILQ